MLTRYPKAGDKIEYIPTGETWIVHHVSGNIAYECASEINSKLCFIIHFYDIGFNTMHRIIEEVTA